jgi:two-component system, NarL family, invasion response regulator UvrY
MKQRPQQNDNMIKVALADDHILLRNALGNLIDGFGDCRVTIQAGSGTELVKYITDGTIPDVVLLDLNMPGMDGFDTANWLFTHQPGIHVLMLTMYDSELSLIHLLKSGVKGFLKKDIHPSELKFAIHAVMESGYYYSNYSTGKLINLFRKNKDGEINLHKAMLNEQEREFLKLAASDLTYKEIAWQMKLNPRSIDTLRDQLFNKLDVKSRVGLVMVAIRHGLVTI